MSPVTAQITFKLNDKQGSASPIRLVVPSLCVIPQGSLASMQDIEAH